MNRIRNFKKFYKRCIGKPFLLDTLCRINSRPQVIVLGFHDVCEDHGILSWLRMRESIFVEMIEKLGDHCSFIHPDDLFNKQALSRRKLNLLVTFDDGFVNNRRLAMPILQAFGIPALFFVSSENLKRQSLFWFDRIIIPIQAGNIQQLDLTPVGLGRYDFDTSGDPPIRWDSIERLLVDIKKLGNPDDPAVKQILDYFDEVFEEDIETNKEDFRPMTPLELKQLAADPLFSIGSHSHNHVILTRLDKNGVDGNLKKSKEILEQVTNCQVDSFACPNGDTSAAIKKTFENCRVPFRIRNESR
jgi:peptidoglycan/xylan/chitin deacetylase (PgdA/CDA1 family)